MKAILLVDIGNPKSTTLADIHDYLQCIYSDAFILPEFAGQQPRYTLDQATASTLQCIDASSVLQTIVETIQTHWQWPATYAYRYGEPSIGAGIQHLLQETNGRLDQLHVIPLFPQRTAVASQAIQTAIQHYIQAFKIPVSIRVQKPYIATLAYQQAIANQLQTYDTTATLIAGFHGSNAELIKKMDTSRITCLSMPNCCENPTPVSDGCSRRQAYALCRAINPKIQPVFLDTLFTNSDTDLHSGIEVLDHVNHTHVIGCLPGWITPSMIQQLDGHYLDTWIQSKTPAAYTRLAHISEAMQYSVIASSIGLTQQSVLGTENGNLVQC